MYLRDDISGDIGWFHNAQDGWSIPTQAAITSYLLKLAKLKKIRELKTKLSAFKTLGMRLGTERFNLEETSVAYIDLQNRMSSGGTDRYIFYATDYTKYNFTDQTGFDNFFKSMRTEQKRIMDLYNNYRGQINVCNSIGGPQTPILDNIIIDFTT